MPTEPPVPPTFLHWFDVLSGRHLPGGAEVVWSEHLSGCDRSTPGLRVVLEPLRDETTPSRLIATCEALGLTPEFAGLGRSAPGLDDPDLVVSVVRPGAAEDPQTAPPAEFRVVAIVCTYNEADVIGSTIRHLVAQGVEVLLVDNWSNDDTVAVAVAAAGDRLVDVVKHPSTGPADEWVWHDMLRRVEELALGLGPGVWVIRNDADEQRWAPWPDVTLREALHHADRCGATAVNHTLLNFRLTDDALGADDDPAHRLFHFEPGDVADRTQLNAWKQPTERVDLASTGGHTVRFEGRRIFPYNFLLCHYPLRTLEQARRKVFAERRHRSSLLERKQGWHDHYDSMSEADLLTPRAGLLTMTAGFSEQFLVERLSGVGFGKLLVPRNWRHRVARVLKGVGVLEPLERSRRRLRSR